MDYLTIYYGIVSYLAFGTILAIIRLAGSETDLKWMWQRNSKKFFFAALLGAIFSYVFLWPLFIFDKRR